jgi:hypothetical protein
MSITNNKVRYVAKSVLDSATVTENSEVSGLPATNLQSRLVRQEYHTTGKTLEFVNFDAGAPTGFDAVGLINTNMTKNGTALLLCNTSENMTSPALTVTLAGATDNFGNVFPKRVDFLSNVTMYQYFRLKMQDAANASSALKAGRLFVGRSIVPTQNVREGMSEDVVDPSVGQKTAGRQSYFKSKTRYKRFSYAVGVTKRPQTDQMVSLFYEVGRYGSVLYAHNPSEEPVKDTIYAEVSAESLSITNRVVSQKDISEIVFEEKI